MIDVGGIALLPEAPRFLAFALAGLALNLVPGADMTFVIASAARHGTRGGVRAALGVGAGALVHVLAAAAGLSALIASSRAAFSLLKWVGAAYLLYVALRLLKPSAATQATEPLSPPDLFRGGMRINVLNPKVGLFFLAFLPQFVDPHAAIPALQVLALGVWFDLVGTMVNVLVAIVAAGASRRLVGVPGLAIAARWLAATLLGGLAVKLAVSRQE